MHLQGRRTHQQNNNNITHKMYIITPRDQMSHDLSYFSGPKTSGAVDLGESVTR